jgi:hypothetical protein
VGWVRGGWVGFAPAAGGGGGFVPGAGVRPNDGGGAADGRKVGLCCLGPGGRAPAAEGGNFEGPCGDGGFCLFLLGSGIGPPGAESNSPVGKRRIVTRAPGEGL